MNFKQFHQLSEGINDKGIFKALFVVGIASSGKTTISTPLKFYAKHIDVDAPLEYFSEKYNVDLSKNGEAEKKKHIRDTAERVTTEKIINYVDGMLPMVVNIVGDDIEMVKNRIRILRDFGYDVGMIYINADIEYAFKKVLARKYGKKKELHRHVSHEYVYDSYQRLLKNVKEYQDMLYDRAGSNVELLDFYTQIRNDGVITNETIEHVHREAKKFFNGELKNPKGKKLLQQLKDERKKTLTDIISKGEIIDRVSKWY